MHHDHSSTTLPRGGVQPVSGWPLPAFGAIDAASPGFLWQAMQMRPLWRQAVFLAMSAGLVERPFEFLAPSTGEAEHDATWVGVLAELATNVPRDPPSSLEGNALCAIVPWTVLPSRTPARRSKARGYMPIKMSDEADVTRVLECAFLICGTHGMGEPVLNTLGEQASWTRRALMARDAIAFAERTGDIAGAKAMFNPETPCVMLPSDTALPGWDGPIQIIRILDELAGHPSQAQLDLLLDETADSITDDLVKKLGLLVALYAVQSNDQTSPQQEAAYLSMLARWNLKHSDLQDWWADVLFPIVGEPCDVVGVTRNDGGVEIRPKGSRTSPRSVPAGLFE